ncbi:MAG: hypothetical protein WA240_11595 [Nitrospirota bacterium]
MFAFSGSLNEFVVRVIYRLTQLGDEIDADTYIMPVGIFLVIDEEHGGSSTAKELIRRFKLLDLESRNFIDFHYLGWIEFPDGSLEFDLREFEKCRDALKKVGVTEFGGNADLILVDAVRKPNGIFLNFEQAIRLNLSVAVIEKEVPDLGEFLQTVISVAEEVRKTLVTSVSDSPVFKISDRLGVAVAKQSLLDFLLDKWGKIIGAKRLKAIAIRSIGPNVDIGKL